MQNDQAGAAAGENLFDHWAAKARAAACCSGAVAQGVAGEGGGDFYDGAKRVGLADRASTPAAVLAARTA